MSPVLEHVHDVSVYAYVHVHTQAQLARETLISARDKMHVQALYFPIKVNKDIRQRKWKCNSEQSDAAICSL